MNPIRSLAAVIALALLTPACGGETQESCTVSTEDGVQVMRCPDGSSLQLGDGTPGAGCTVETADDGGTVLRCPDGSETPIEDGTPGRDGLDGTDGRNGNDGRDGVDGLNGRDGQDGTDGVDGADALVRTEPEPPGSTCVAGGTRVIVGLDRNDNGILEPEEETGRTVICNGMKGNDGADGSDGTDGTDGTDGQDGTDGTDGGDGLDALVDLSDEAPGVDCEFGGVRIASGLDLDGDGTLDPDEVTATRFVCNAPTWTLGLRFEEEWQAIGAGVDNLVTLRAQIVGAYDPFARLRWRVRFTDAAGLPVTGVELTTGADPIAWRSWTDVSFSDANGEVILGGTGFEAGAAGLLAAEGALVHWRLGAQTVGMLTTTVELLGLGDTVVGAGSVDVQVAPVTTGVTLWGFGDLPASVRSLAVINTRVDPTIDPSMLVSWRYTLRTAVGVPVDGAAFYYDPDATDGFGHMGWTASLVTDANGVAVHEPAGVEARELQLFRGLNFPISFGLPPGEYTLDAELVEVVGGAVMASSTATFTTAHLPAMANFLHFDAMQANARSFVAIQARHATTASTTAAVRWQATLTRSGVPMAGHSIFMGDPDDHLYHAWWTDAAVTDTDGKAWLGDVFPAPLAMGIDGQILGLSLRLASGSYGFRLQLIDTATDVAVWDYDTNFVVP